jgi:type IV pilus assembly protein PilV
MVSHCNGRGVPSRHGQRGVSLIEVLITVLVLSVGLLGLAGLQMNAVRSNQGAFENSAAVVESYSIIDAMRTERVVAINGGFDLGLAEAPTPGTFAGNELEKWRQRLVDIYGPDATGSVDCNGADCTVVVQWDDQWGFGEEETTQITLQVQL